MILRYSSFSPYVRKVRVCAAEMGLADRIELVETNPHEDETLREHNPLAKVPTLVLPGGTAIFDSHVICVYLAELAGNHAIVPCAGSDSWRILRDEALGDGICDAAVALRGEKIRPETFRYPVFVARQTKAITAACDVLDRECERLAGRVDIGVIAIACAIGYLDLRHPELEWRRRRSDLADWHASFESRDSMNRSRHIL